jgi:AbrB family looped-hinge helix DNA binding protein
MAGRTLHVDGIGATIRITMTVTMDAAGRLVIPKELRERAHLEPGVPLDVTLRDGRIEIAPAPREVKFVQRGRFRVAVPTEASAPLTEDTVRAVRRHLRERDR